MNIKKYRLLRGLSQKEIAEKIHTTQSNYSKYELGSLEPSITTFILLSKIFNVSIDELVGNDNIAKGNRKELLEKISLLTDEECKKLCNYAEGILANRNK